MGRVVRIWQMLQRVWRLVLGGFMVMCVSFYLQEESSPATGSVREEKTSCVTVSHMTELTATRHLVLLVRYEL